MDWATIWATFWATFSQTHLVTLMATQRSASMYHANEQNERMGNTIQIMKRSPLLFMREIQRCAVLILHFLCDYICTLAVF
jgi:hypothetical protein